MSSNVGFSALRAAFSGTLLTPNDADYDEARTIWNAMVDKRPAIIARCATTQDIVHAVNFARDNELQLAVRNYWKSHNFTTLSDELFDVVIDYVGKLPTGDTEIFFGALGGATKRPAPDATAFPHRDMEFVMNVHGRWIDASDDERCIAWSREYFNAAAPFASAGAYVNFMTADETDRVRSAFGANYDRLAQAKTKHDPNNLFRTNWSVKPA